MAEHLSKKCHTTLIFSSCTRRALPLALMFCIVVLLEAHSARLLGSTANRQGGAGGTTASSSSRAGASVYVLIGVREPAVWFGRSLAGEVRQSSWGCSWVGCP